MTRETVTIYRCDWDNKVLSGDSSGGIPHLSITIQGASGRVEPLAGEKPAWEYTRILPPGIHQFCNTACLAHWVDDPPEGHDG